MSLISPLNFIIHTIFYLYIDRQMNNKNSICTKPKLGECENRQNFDIHDSIWITYYVFYDLSVVVHIYTYKGKMLIYFIAQTCKSWKEFICCFVFGVKSPQVLMTLLTTIHKNQFCELNFIQKQVNAENFCQNT